MKIQSFIVNSDWNAMFRVKSAHEIAMIQDWNFLWFSTEMLWEVGTGNQRLFAIND